MKTARVSEAQASPQTAPNLAGWRDGLEQVRTQAGECAELSAKLEQLGAEQDKLFSDREAALSQEDEETLARLLARGQILDAREKKLQAELAQAQERSQTTLGHVQGHFAILARIYGNHVFEVEKKRLTEAMSPGCQIGALEQVVLFLKPVSDAKNLEIAQDADFERFTTSGARLLSAIEAASGFSVPAFTPLSAAGTAEQAEKPPEALAGPFADLPNGLTQREIDREWARIREENPLLTMAEAGRKLAQLHPEIFLTQAQVQELNKPIGQSTTPEKWRAPMIGSTRVPEGEGPPVQERDQIFETLNAR